MKSALIEQRESVASGPVTVGPAAEPKSRAERSPDSTPDRPLTRPDPTRTPCAKGLEALNVIAFSRDDGPWRVYRRA